MFGSGEKTVAPTTDFPSRSFCLAVLKFRTGAFCCCACASPSTIQDSAIQIVANEMEYSSLTGLHLGSTTFDRRRIILRPRKQRCAPQYHVNSSQTRPALSIGAAPQKCLPV